MVCEELLKDPHMSIQEIQNETAGNSSEQKCMAVQYCITVMCSSRTSRLLFLFFTSRAALKCCLPSLSCTFPPALYSTACKLASSHCVMDGTNDLVTHLNRQLPVPALFSPSAKAKFCFPLTTQLLRFSPTSLLLFLSLGFPSLARSYNPHVSQMPPQPSTLVLCDPSKWYPLMSTITTSILMVPKHEPSAQDSPGCKNITKRLVGLFCRPFRPRMSKPRDTQDFFWGPISVCDWTSSLTLIKPEISTPSSSFSLIFTPINRCHKGSQIRPLPSTPAATAFRSLL